MPVIDADQDALFDRSGAPFEPLDEREDAAQDMDLHPEDLSSETKPPPKPGGARHDPEHEPTFLYRWADSCGRQTGIAGAATVW